MKHGLNSVSYHLCPTEIGDARYIYRTCLKISGDVKLKTTTKTNELHVQPVPYNPWPTLRSIENSVRSDFFKGGKAHDFHTYWEVFIVGRCF
jgi:hypothetical protein